MNDIDAETQVDEIMKKLDADGSGSIDYSGIRIYNKKNLHMPQ